MLIILGVKRKPHLSARMERVGCGQSTAPRIGSSPPLRRFMTKTSTAAQDQDQQILSRPPLCLCPFVIRCLLPRPPCPRPLCLFSVSLVPYDVPCMVGTSALTSIRPSRSGDSSPRLPQLWESRTNGLLGQEPNKERQEMRRRQMSVYNINQTSQLDEGRHSSWGHSSLPCFVPLTLSSECNCCKQSPHRRPAAFSLPISEARRRHGAKEVHKDHAQEHARERRRLEGEVHAGARVALVRF